jgi:hypothetical protein
MCESNYDDTYDLEDDEFDEQAFLESDLVHFDDGPANLDY